MQVKNSFALTKKKKCRNSELSCSFSSFTPNLTHIQIGISTFNVVKHIRNNLSFFVSKLLATCTFYKTSIRHF
jgi:hypothetical protein